MNNSNRYNQNNKYSNSHYGGRYAKYSNARYPYANDNRSEKHYYNQRSYHNYPRERPCYSNAPGTFNHNFNPRPRQQFYSQSGYNMSNRNDYYSENQNAFFRSDDYTETPNSEAIGQDFEHFISNDETPVIKNPFSSALSCSGNGSKSTWKYYSDGISSFSEISKEKDQGVISNANELVNSVEGNASTSKKIGSVGKAFKCTSKRIRSKSVSSFESEKKGNDRNENQADSESEEQKIKEWTDSLLETSNNQISRLINPSNYKEKAAVNQLITKFSKSKRKENLTRTLRTNSTELTENDDKNEDEIYEIVEPINMEAEEISIILDSKKNSDLEQNVTDFQTLPKSRQNFSKKSDSNQDLINKSTPNVTTKSPINQSSKKYRKGTEKIKDSSFTSSKQSAENHNSVNYGEKYVKRKSVDSDKKNKKKQKTINLKSSEGLNTLGTTKLQEKNKDTPVPVNSAPVSVNSTPVPVNSLPVPASQASSNVLSDIKAEIMEHCEVNETVPSTSTSSENTQIQVFGSDISVETLIKLFASGNIKVKEEFSDPVVEALKEISPDELISACSKESFNASDSVNTTAADSVKRKNSKDKSSSGTSVNTNQDDSNSITPVIMGSAVINENLSSVSATLRSESLVQNVSVSDKSDNQTHLSSICINNSSDASTSDTEKITTLNKTKIEMPPHVNKLIKQLQDIALQEETVKQSLNEAKSKINEYTFLIEEWKRKKMKLHEQEEDLRKHRNNIIKALQSTVKTDGDDNKKEPSSVLPKENASADQPTTSKKKQETESRAATIGSPDVSHIASTISPPAKHQKQKKNESSRSSESDEISILSPPRKPQPLEIIIFDDEDVCTSISNKSKELRHKMDTNLPSDNKPTFFDLKSINAHATVVNCLVVFEDFLYTCSNDYSAKRFSLKDASLTVTYCHTAKNVSEIVVEKVQNEALVFTSCPNKFMSLFIASSGTKLKTFFPPCPVGSICKGWGKFYSGLANGCVNVYNWKYEEIEIVKTEHPVSRIATAHQGRLHVLVILSSEGNISIRDAETGLVIRYIKIFLKHPAWMCLHNDLVYLNSSDKILIIVDIMSGKMENRLYLNSATTGLAVYDNCIFTISFNGIINCYNPDKKCDKKLYYGAGRNGLTCIHTYHNWVFTGNRKGEVSLFHFDKNFAAVCEFPKCDIVYGLKEDLVYHVEKDHLLKKKNLEQCNWKGCKFSYPRSADVSDRMNHIKTHIYAMNCSPTTM